MQFYNNLLIGSGENYVGELYKRVPNSPFDYEEKPLLSFKCKIASNKEKTQFQMLSGILGNESRLQILSTRLPSEIEVNDRILILGKYYVVESVGYYLTDNALVNPNLMSNEYIMARCPKGISLK